jgi:hypothetical protein
MIGGSLRCCQRGSRRLKGAARGRGSSFGSLLRGRPSPLRDPRVPSIPSIPFDDHPAAVGENTSAAQSTSKDEQGYRCGHQVGVGDGDRAGAGENPPPLTCILPRCRGVIQAIEREPRVSGQRKRVDRQRGEELRGFLISRRGFSGSRSELGEAVGDEED